MNLGFLYDKGLGGLLHSHEVLASRLKVRVFTTAFPGWSTVDSFSKPPTMVPPRRKDFCY
jgi:hypothetical protein